jgi:hypothetical protein
LWLIASSWPQAIAVTLTISTIDHLVPDMVGIAAIRHRLR